MQYSILNKTEYLDQFVKLWIGAKMFLVFIIRFYFIRVAKTPLTLNIKNITKWSCYAYVNMRWQWKVRDLPKSERPS